MKSLQCISVLVSASLGASALGAQSGNYPPLSQYLMPRDAEIALARSAAPAGISDRATIKVLTASGYEVASEGDNGAVCLVMRGFSAPTDTPAQFRDLVYDPDVRAPICFTAPAAKTAMPYYELRTRLALHQHLGPPGAWHPHMMVFAPKYDNAMVGGFAFGSPLPQLSDDAGTPFAVVVIPVDDKLAITPQPR